MILIGGVYMYDGDYQKEYEGHTESLEDCYEEETYCHNCERDYDENVNDVALFTPRELIDYLRSFLARSFRKHWFVTPVVLLSLLSVEATIYIYAWEYLK